MPDCEKYYEDISALVDGELSSEDEKAIREHMASCPQCAALYESLLSLHEDINSDIPEASPDLHEKIMEKVKAEPANKVESIFEVSARGRAYAMKSKTYRTARNIIYAAACLALICTAVGVEVKSHKSGSTAETVAAYRASEAASASSFAAPAEAETAEEEMAEESIATFSYSGSTNEMDSTAVMAEARDDGITLTLYSDGDSAVYGISADFEEKLKNLIFTLGDTDKGQVEEPDAEITFGLSGEIYYLSFSGDTALCSDGENKWECSGTTQDILGVFNAAGDYKNQLNG